MDDDEDATLDIQPVTQTPVDVDVERFPSLPNGNGGQMTMEQLWWYANMVSQSAFVPKHLVGKPYDIFTIFSYCKELGISPLAGLNGIAVINGQPRIYGDLLVALIIQHPDFRDFWFEFETGENGLECRCTILRRGRKPFVGVFSEQDARDANLLGKMVWKQYFKQMLMHRALNLAFRYVFPDTVYAGLKLVDSPYSADVGDEIEETAPFKPVPTPSDSSDSTLRNTATISDFILSTACRARGDIIDVYSNLFCTQGEDFHEALVTTCSVLIEYVNSSTVDDGFVGILQKFNPVRDKLAPIINDELSFLDDSFLIKSINRLVDKYVITRIKLVARFKALCDERGLYEAAIFNQSQLVSKHLGTEKWGRGEEAKAAFPILSSLPYQLRQGDYTFIPLEILETVVDMFVDSRFLADSLSSSEIDLLSTILAQTKSHFWQILSPFVKFPDVRAVSRTQFNDVVKYAHYHLYFGDGANVEFLSDDEIVDFAVYLGCDKANGELEEYMKAISYNTVGIPSVDPAKIPVKCFYQYAEYQTYMKKKESDQR